MKKRYLLAFLLIFICYSFSHAQVSITGKITDEKSIPISGVSVHLLNTSWSTTTNKTGEFEFDKIPRGIYIIEFSAFGFASLSTEINANTNLNIGEVLRPSFRELGQVTISAQKTDEIHQKAAASITSLSSREVEQYRIWSTTDLTAIAPNLTSAESGDKRNVTSIRGIVSTSYEQAVATYIDGVNQFGLDTYISQLFDIERIELLRGPQGNLYGRNAMGGVINIITRKPTNKLAAFGEVSLANYGQTRIAAGLRFPIIANKLFAGVAAMYEVDNGFYENEFNNTRYDKKNSLTANYYIRYAANTPWSFTMNLKHANNRNRGPFPLTFGIDESFQRPFILNQNAVTRMEDNIMNGSVSAVYNGNKFSFSSQTSIQSNYRFYEQPIDADFSPLDAVSIQNNYGKDWNKVNVITQELRFSSPASSTNRFKWLAGAYLFHQKSPVKQTTLFGDDATLTGAPENNFSLINSTIAKNSGLALFGNGTYSFGKFQLGGGLRFDLGKKKQNILGEYQKDPDPTPQFDFRPDTSASANFHAFSPKISLSYLPSSNQTFFIIYSDGFRAGGLTPLSADPSQPPLYAYKPETSHNFEAGIKNTLANKKLSINLATFYTTVSDVQVPTLVLPDAVTITRNTGKLSSKGLELELNAIPMKGFELNWSLGYTNARFDELKVSQNNSAIDLKGKRQIFTPEVTSFLAGQYNLDLSKKNQFIVIVRGEWRYLGRQYFDLANTLQQSPYSILNGKLGMEMRNVSIMLWGRNLGDKKYILYAYDFGAIHLGQPLTYGLTISVRI